MPLAGSAAVQLCQEHGLHTDFRAIWTYSLTCLLSRAEPRDLVDVLFLERSGFLPENDVELALQKDAGIDPAILAWLINQIPVQPLPVMLTPLTEEALSLYRTDLAERFKQVALARVVET